MDKEVPNVENIEKQLLNISTNISQLREQLSNKEIQVVLPQLEETNSILNKLNSETTQSIVLQNDKAIQIEYVNQPNFLDYMTAWGTVGAVVVAIWVTLRNDRDQRKDFCRFKKFDFIFDTMIIDVVGGEKEENICINSQYMRFSVFNKCTFATLEIKKIAIDFFNFYNEHLFSQDIDREIKIYSENDIVNSLCLSYKGENNSANLQSFFSLSQKYAIDNNISIKLAKNPKLVITTNFGEFNIHPTREAKKILKNEFKKFIKSTPHSK